MGEFIYLLLCVGFIIWLCYGAVRLVCNTVNVAKYTIKSVEKKAETIGGYCPKCKQWGTMKCIKKEKEISERDSMVRKTATATSRHSYDTFDVEYYAPGKEYYEYKVKTYKCDNCGHIERKV